MTEKEIISIRYIITQNGEVINKKRNRLVIFNKDKKGYLKARLYCPEISKNKDKRKPYRLHRLVAMYYLDNFSNDLQVNHIDGNKTNNYYKNLEMVTNSENAKHAWTYLDNDNKRRNKLKFCPITGQFIKRK